MKNAVVQKALQWTVVALFAVLSAESVAAPSTNTLTEGRDFVTIGNLEMKKHTLRSPGICLLPDGRLFAAYCRRPIAKVRREAENGGIAGTYSSDEGRTWTPPEPVFDSARDDEDPAIACTPDGTLICTFVPHRQRGAVGTSLGTHIIQRKPGMTDWSPVVRIAPRYNCSAPVHVLRNGRLVLGLWASDETRYAPASVCASADANKWMPVVLMGEDRPPRLAETDIVERSDGWLYAISRIQNKNPDRTFFYSISQDQGETWDQPVPLDFSGIRPRLLRTSKGAIICAYSVEQVFLRYSLDDGLTFGPAVQVDGAGSNSPSMAELPDGSVMIVYVRRDLFRIRRFQIEDSGVVWKSFAAPTR